jgi:anaerobic selenocysteine-containing dehydrogenase
MGTDLSDKEAQHEEGQPMKSAAAVPSMNALIKAKIPGEATGIEIKKSLCSICGAQCGINAYVREGRIIKIEGTAENPVNRGVICAKGAAGRQWVYNAERIKSPLLRTGERGSGEYRPISWEDALDRISARLLEIKRETGPESVVFFTGYPKWLRPFLKRLAHSFGSPNYCTESSTCFLATVLASRLTYGCAAGPEIKDATCILNWSSNPSASGASQVAHFLDALDRGVKLIDVGPLLTPLAARADVHLRIRPGTSGALALAMANVIVEEGLYDREFVDNWTVGFDEYKALCREFSPDAAERITGVPAEKILAAARLYATSKPATMTGSASATVHYTNGVQNHRAITALIGLTGNFDRKGGNHVVPSSYYHRPTGLKHREEEFEQSRPWEGMAPRLGQDRHPVWCSLISEAQATMLPFQISSGKPYPIRGMLSFGLNHRMWPAPDFMMESLKKLDFLVDVDLFMTDSARLADIVLPACTSLERSELAIFPSRYAVWTEPAIEPLYESRPDVDIIVDLSRRLNPEDTLLTSGHEACLDWIFEPSAITVAGLKGVPGGSFLSDRSGTPYEKYRASGFPTPTGKMEFASSILKEAGFDSLPTYKEPAQSPVSTPEIAKDFPLVLTTGARLPMHMHSRMHRIPWAKRLRPDPTADVSPRDAEARRIGPGEWVQLVTTRGAIRVRANITEFVSPGVVNVYHGFPEGDANELIDPDYRDPISGYPGYKSLLCDVRKLEGKGGAM